MQAGQAGAQFTRKSNYIRNMIRNDVLLEIRTAVSYSEARVEGYFCVGSRQADLSALS